MSPTKTNRGVIAFVVAVSILALAYWQMFSAVSSDNQSYLFTINRGQTLSQVADALKEHKFIRSSFAFAQYIKFKNLENSLMPGRYRISPSFNVKEIAILVTDKKNAETSITIPEGFEVKDIDSRLSEMGLILPGEFLTAASQEEGYLFPDTYFVYSKNFSPESLIKKMRENFNKKITQDLTTAAQKRNRKLEDIIIMASILEKEVRTEMDYPIVSGILWKRLKTDWPLQADATSLYGKDSNAITGQYLAEKSAYNTRIQKGLPPTPICNPGMMAIRAAINPEESPYWFYLTDSDGNVHYAKTNAEHEANRARYL